MELYYTRSITKDSKVQGLLGSHIMSSDTFELFREHFELIFNKYSRAICDCRTIAQLLATSKIISTKNIEGFTDKDSADLELAVMGSLQYTTKGKRDTYIAREIIESGIITPADYNAFYGSLLFFTFALHFQTITIPLLTTILPFSLGLTSADLLTYESLCFGYLKELEKRETETQLKNT